MPRRFTISKSVSGRSWGDVDKSRIWQLLKQGLQEGAEGVVAAVREVYAVVKAPINADLTQADCWGPHHEISDDGTVTLNRGGVIAAAGALAGARAEPDLTPEQRDAGRAHIRRHYRELEMPIPASLAGEGETVRLTAYVAGEMSIHDVPLGSGIDVATLKQGDPDPMEVVVEIPAGRSKRGWVYTMQALRDIAQEVMTNGLLGFLGHQKAEDVDHEFPTPVTHWVGAKIDEAGQKLYLRGVIDKAAADLKRWIRARSVRSTSIFGVPKLVTANGETLVVGYVPLSNDWAPPGREGMATRVVAWGEMVTDEIVSHNAGGEFHKMSWKELVAKLRDMLKTGEVTLKQIAGELGLTLDAVGEAVDEAVYKGLKADAERLVKVKQAFGVTGEMDVVKVAQDSQTTLKKVREIFKATGETDVIKVAEEAAKALAAQKAAEHDKAVGEMLTAKLTSETVKKDILNPETQIGKLWAYHKARIPQGATKEQIASEIDAFLGDKVVKAIIDTYHTDRPALVGGSNEPKTTLRVKREQI